MNNSGLLLFKKFKFRKIFSLIIIGVIFLICSAFFAGRVYIKHEANNFAKEASAVFNKDKTESLLLLIESENYSLKDKNNAIWALGVLKDEKALPKLEMLYTGEECNHSESLCQYELKKAILKIKGEFKGSWQASR